ncbi:ABC transporter permease [Cellulomonas sp. SLBN-39]|uniref:ABC transporter permease n=1 Tax=Cellulomonas sp. SLBN-39 TaxID=2768446 RepID=UPI001154C2BA|nr:ABC transporter permease [Cellulomonas sp. SLBN-39]TQL02106.1 putative ABC transport system permease protein [Cellulomonas sp. SLBN-39]
MTLSTVTDLIRDVLVEMHTRHARTALMAAGVALATGALVASLSISRLAATQIDTDLAATATRTVTVARVTTEQDAGDATFPEDAASIASGLPLVEAAGLRLDLTGKTSVTVRTDDPVLGPDVDGLVVAGITSGYPAAVGAEPATTAWMLDGEHPVVLLGPGAAEALDVPVSADPTGHGVWVNGVRHQVVGFLVGSPVVDGLVALPYPRVEKELSTDADATMTVLTEPGASGPVSAAIRAALRPDVPAVLRTSVVVDASEVRRGVATQLDRLTAGIGALLLALTMLLIANSMVVSVMSRTAEIGLRRAMGASRSGIAALVLLEAAVSGVVGGVSGSAVAAVVVLVAAVANSWTAHMDVGVLALAPVVGLGVATLASVYPALRAAAVQPATAVRSD